MPSPFPGMDPYLEQPTLWPSFHFRLIGAIAAAIEPQLSLEYYVEVETRTYQGEATEDLLIGIADAEIVTSSATLPSPPIPAEAATSVATPTKPQRVTLPMPLPVQERYLEVREVGSHAVVTVIEVLSPTNKRMGTGRNIYEAKRRNILSSASHLVEIDLLRGGQPMPIVDPPFAASYQILVSRSELRPAADWYAIALQQTLPKIAIPLKADEEASVLVDLQAILTRVYDEARYAIRLDYTQPPPPPTLSPDDQTWVQQLLTAKT
jgi:hypothetical protein